MKPTESNIKVLIVLLILTSLIGGCTRRSFPEGATYPPTGYTKQNGILEKPFQVIFSENSYLHDSVELENLDFIPASGEITVKEGYLILAHFSGYMFKYEGDTKILIEVLNSKISRTLNLSEKPRFRMNGGIFYEQIPQKAGAVGAVSRCYNTPIWIVSESTITISANKPVVYLSWLCDLKEVKSNFRISVLSIFDEPIDEITVEGYNSCLDFTNYVNEHPLLLIQVINANNTYAKSDPLGVKFGSQDFLIPNNCEIKTPIEALEHAFYYETILEYNLALEFYDLAVSISDQGIFKVFRDNFVARNRGFLRAL